MTHERPTGADARRLGHDRPPRRRAAVGAQRPGPPRRPRRAPALRLARPRHLAARAGGRRAPSTSPTARHRAPEAAEAVTEPRRAVDAGVERLVLLCAAAGQRRRSSPRQGFHAAAPSGTVLRCSWFAQNSPRARFAAGVAAASSCSRPTTRPRSRSSTSRTSPTWPSPRSPEDRHRGRTYELTGPRLLRHADAMAVIGAVLGRPVRLSRGEEPTAPAPRFIEALDGRNERLPRGRPRPGPARARLPRVRPPRGGGRHLGRAGPAGAA